MDYFTEQSGNLTTRLIYAVTAIFPFMILLSIFGGFTMGVESLMILATWPLGIILLSIWSLQEDRNRLFSLPLITLLAYLTIRGLFSPAGMGWQEITRLIALTGIVMAVSKSSVSFLVLCKIILVTAFLELLFVIGFMPLEWQHQPAMTGACGTFGADNKLATFLIVALPCAFYVTHNGETRKARVGGWVGMCLVIIMQWLSTSRAGMAISIFQVVVLFALNFRSDITVRKIVFQVGKMLIPLAVIVVLIRLDVSNGQFKRILENGQDFKGGFHIVYGAPEFKSYTKRIIQDHPIIGVGAGKWKHYARKQGLGDVWEHCHNELGQCLAEYGVVGTVLFISFLLLVLYLGLHARTALLITVSLLIHSFTAGLRTPEQTYYFALMCGVIFQQTEILLKGDSQCQCTTEKWNSLSVTLFGRSPRRTPPSSKVKIPESHALLTCMDTSRM